MSRYSFCSKSIHWNASNGLFLSVSNSQQLFSFGKKKKRKPVCTCHLGYADGTAGGLYGLDPSSQTNGGLANSYPNSPYLGLMPSDAYASVASNGTAMLSSNGYTSQPPYSPSHHPSSSSPRPYGGPLSSSPNASINPSSHQHLSTSHPGTPHHQNYNGSHSNHNNNGYMQNSWNGTNCQVG